MTARAESPHLGAIGEQRPDVALFDEVIGQPAAVALLMAAARHPVHAYLFRGAAGFGTKAAARAFAGALLCPHGGCARCADCRRALAGTHPDFAMIERTGASLGIDEARRLIALAQRRPVVAARQVLVVEDLHLAIRSAPTLLKTIEEPPPSTVFILMADDVPPELATIASRCVEVLFPPIPVLVLEDWLRGQGVESDRAAAIAEGADGDLERARLLAHDPSYLKRLALWRSVPSRLSGHGAEVVELVSELVAAVDAALGPLRDQHAEELRKMTETEVRASGASRRALQERQHREERRWRIAELRVGLGVLARCYRDSLFRGIGVPVSPMPGTASSGQESAETPGTQVTRRGLESALGSAQRAISLITEAAAGLIRNPNETLFLESLLVELGRCTR